MRLAGDGLLDGPDGRGCGNFLVAALDPPRAGVCHLGSGETVLITGGGAFFSRATKSTLKYFSAIFRGVWRAPPYPADLAPFLAGVFEAAASF